MTWRWWLFTAVLCLAVEILARKNYGALADGIALALLFVAGVVMIVRRFRARQT